MLGIQMHEVAMIFKGIYPLIIIVLGLLTHTSAVSMTEMELIRQELPM